MSFLLVTELYGCLFPEHLYHLPSPFLKKPFSFNPQNTCCEDLRKSPGSAISGENNSVSSCLKYPFRAGETVAVGTSCSEQDNFCDPVYPMVQQQLGQHRGWGHLLCHRSRNNPWIGGKRNFLHKFHYQRKHYGNYSLKGHILMQ